MIQSSSHQQKINPPLALAIRRKGWFQAIGDRNQLQSPQPLCLGDYLLYVPLAGLSGSCR
ncbi:hypothetical protein J5X98_21555 [Leptothermofonsia sichuanensis E412]|uniref:hypothetical protein n=1 Tax=Leptothermofonsia sichuanensis TaxID=2917832 RepID=UPI001CA766AE|nr:hypothetical protein [Leptothermofonsia sichuanensis]QZZ19868.1 hypothetical protein J5X98_21555 [Leptothermofonsia sichuanensis E412]